MLWFLSCRKEWEEQLVNNNYLATRAEGDSWAAEKQQVPQHLLEGKKKIFIYSL